MVKFVYDTEAVREVVEILKHNIFVKKTEIKVEFHRIVEAQPVFRITWESREHNWDTSYWKSIGC